MLNLLTVAFEAHHNEHNHHRRYRITIGRDLLDDWVVNIHYGRQGQRGQEQQFVHTDEKKLRAIVRERLQRRLSAPRRIGCAYRLQELNSASGFDANAWLPGELLARFFPATTGFAALPSQVAPVQIDESRRLPSSLSN